MYKRQLVGVGDRSSRTDTHTGNAVVAAKNRAQGMGDLTIPVFRPRGIPPDEVVNLAENDAASSSSDSESGFIPFSSTPHPAGRSLVRPSAAGGGAADRDTGDGESSDSGFIPFLRPSEAAAAATTAAAAAAAPSTVGKAIQKQ